MQPNHPPVRGRRPGPVTAGIGLIALVLFAGMPPASAGALDVTGDKQLVETNVDDHAMRIANDPNSLFVDTPVKVTRTWNELTYYSKRFIVGWELQIASDAIQPADLVLPAEVPVNGSGSETEAPCYLDEFGFSELGPSGATHGVSERNGYRLYPDVYARVGGMVGQFLPQKVYILLEGTAAGSLADAVGGARFDCIFEIPLLVTTLTEQFHLPLLTTVSSIPVPPVTLPFGSLIGSGQRIDKADTTPPSSSSAPLQLMGVTETLTFFGSVASSYSDSGDDWHDEDYMELSWTEGDAQLADKGIVPDTPEQVSPPYVLEDGAVREICVTAEAWDQDTVTGDDMSDREAICLFVKYTFLEDATTKIELPETCLALAIARDWRTLAQFGEVPEECVEGSCLDVLLGVVAVSQKLWVVPVPGKDGLSCAAAILGSTA